MGLTVDGDSRGNPGDQSPPLGGSICSPQKPSSAARKSRALGPQTPNHATQASPDDPDNDVPLTSKTGHSLQSAGTDNHHLWESDRWGEMGRKWTVSQKVVELEDLHLVGAARQSRPGGSEPKHARATIQKTSKEAARALTVARSASAKEGKAGINI